MASWGRRGASTRQYAAGIARVTVGAASAASAAIAAEEVLLHPSTRCFVRTGPVGSTAATNNDIPLEAGEKFHLRITNGDCVAVIQDSGAGVLNIVPVAG